MTASVPFVAPATPPLTGESTHATLRSPAALATTFATLGPVVDKSISVFSRDPRRMPPSPVLTACTIGGVGRLMSTISAAEATASADDAAVAPRATSAFTASALVSYTVSGKPASSNRTAIGPPMRPTPTNPSSCAIRSVSLSLNEGIRNVLRRRYPHALHLQILLDHFLTALAPQSRSLVSAERRQITDRSIRV